MMTTKKFNKAMAEANKTSKRNTVIAAGAAGLTGVITSAAVYLINNHKNNKIDKEIDNLRNDITTLNTSVAVTENILAATTKAAATDKDTDTKSHVKYAPINIYEFTGAITNKVAIFTKSVTGDDVTFEPVPNPSLEGYSFNTKYYMAEKDYNEIFKTATTEETKDEDNKTADDKK